MFESYIYFEGVGYTLTCLPSVYHLCPCLSVNVPCGPTSRLPLSSMSAAAEPKPTPVPAEESLVKTEEGAEQQNQLPQKLTEAEWKAVKELRVRVCLVPSPPTRSPEPEMRTANATAHSPNFRASLPKPTRTNRPHRPPSRSGVLSPLNPRSRLPQSGLSNSIVSGGQPPSSPPPSVTPMQAKAKRTLSLSRKT